MAEVFADALKVEICDGFKAGVALEKLDVLSIVHEEVFGEDGWAEGVTEDVEVFFEVGV